MRHRILFVGNSFVSRNDVPGLVRELAVSAGHEAETASIVAGGASLRRHLNSGAVARALQESRWNFVVLQEQSTLPVKNPARFHDNVRALQPLIHDAGAETVLYMTWARRASPESQEALTAAVQAIGKEIGGAVALVGIAWHAVTLSQPGIDLYAADGSHPTAAGSFLAACVLYGVLFRDPGLRVSTPPSAGISHDISEALIEAARRVLQ